MKTVFLKMFFAIIAIIGIIIVILGVNNPYNIINSNNTQNIIFFGVCLTGIGVSVYRYLLYSK